MSRLAVLREKRNRLATEARGILDACEKDERGMNDSERESFKRLHDQIELTKTDIEAEERQENLERELATIAAPGRRSGRDDVGPSADPAENAELERGTFRNWMRYGVEGLDETERTVMAQRQRIITKTDIVRPGDKRALGSTNTAGGYTIPTLTRAEVVSGMKAFGGMRRSRATIITTDSGGAIDWPTNDDTGNTGALLSENATASEQDTTFGTTELAAYIYTSKLIKVPETLIQDSQIDVEAHVRKILTERIGRITETHFATGDGSSKPRGVTVGAANSNVQPDISSGLSVQNLLDIQNSVDMVYQDQAQWMFGQSFLALIQALSFTSAMPWGIWQPSVREGAPDTILGKPYVVNNSMPAAGTATNRVLVYGDMSAYFIRDVRDIVMKRLVERGADAFQVWFVAFYRCDADLIDPGTNPIKYAAQQA